MISARPLRDSPGSSACALFSLDLYESLQTIVATDV
jgi:hypothetical protein